MKTKTLGALVAGLVTLVGIPQAGAEEKLEPGKDRIAPPESNGNRQVAMHKQLVAAAKQRMVRKKGRKSKYLVSQTAGLVGSLERHQRFADESAKDGTAQRQHRDQEQIVVAGR